MIQWVLYLILLLSHLEVFLVLQQIHREKFHLLVLLILPKTQNYSKLFSLFSYEKESFYLCFKFIWMVKRRQKRFFQYILAHAENNFVKASTYQVF